MLKLRTCYFNKYPKLKNYNIEWMLYVLICLADLYYDSPTWAADAERSWYVKKNWVFQSLMFIESKTE